MFSLTGQSGVKSIVSTDSRLVLRGIYHAVVGSQRMYTAILNRIDYAESITKSRYSTV